MLAADAALQVVACAASLVNGHLHEPANTDAVDRFERIGREDLLLHVPLQELAFRVVPAEAEGGLRQVVRAEEKNWAYSAISAAVRAARGSSIIVPNINGMSTPCSATIFLASASS